MNTLIGSRRDGDGSYEHIRETDSQEVTDEIVAELRGDFEYLEIQGPEGDPLDIDKVQQAGDKAMSTETTLTGSAGTPCYAVLRDFVTTHIAGCQKEMIRVLKDAPNSGGYWRGQIAAYEQTLAALDELESLHDGKQWADVPEADFGNIPGATSLLREVWDAVGNHCEDVRRHVLTPGLRDAIAALLKIAGMTSETANVYDAARVAKEAMKSI